MANVGFLRTNLILMIDSRLYRKSVIEINRKFWDILTDIIIYYDLSVNKHIFDTKC